MTTSPPATSTAEVRGPGVLAPDLRPPAGHAPRRGRRRAVYLVERVLDLTYADLRAVQTTLVDASRRVTAEGRPVRYLRSTYVPSQQRWICLFLAADEDAVRCVYDLAGVPFAQIVEALHLAPPGSRALALRR
jgi:hypothetical protein